MLLSFPLILFRLFQPPGHNLNDLFSPPFFTYRSNLSEIRRKGPMTLKEACHYLSTARLPYTYTGSLPYLDSVHTPPPSQDPAASPSFAPLAAGDSSWPTVEPTSAYGTHTQKFKYTYIHTYMHSYASKPSNLSNSNRTSAWIFILQSIHTYIHTYTNLEFE